MSSVISTPSLPTHADSGVGLKPYSRYSQGSPARPMSVLTTPMDRPEFPRAQSQASFSDVHSLGSSSPRRSRFFGFSNFKDGWASRDSLAPSAMMSGSMMDMHVALQKENSDAARYGLGESSRRSQLWSAADLLQPTTSRLSNQSEPKPKKKKGLAKIWGIVTRRHVSTPTLSSSTMKMTMSPVALSPTSASSTHLPTPSSSRPSGSGSDSDTAIARQPSANYDDDQRNPEDRFSKNISSMTSEPDMRRRMSRSPSSSPNHTPTLLTVHTNNTNPVASTIPGDIRRQRSSEQRLAADNRPQTMYTFNPAGGSPAHDFLPPKAPFRNGDVRRQSFGGLTTRPNLDVQLARNHGSTPRSSTALGVNYDEFGGSRRSLRLDSSSQNRASFFGAPTKRKSRFGLTSLFGKKQPERNVMQENVVAQQVPSFRRSAGSDGLDDSMTNGGYGSTSRHSALSASASASAAPGARMSVTSRKALEELVAQDSEFVAYRYPSNDQHLDLLR
ncbi:hypothetical protein CPB85DRAFT_1308584 [Mucidula mucida]|nr:hypothetical protein CPB85DRAFT_1308584 [Mucidula mucida]